MILRRPYAFLIKNFRVINFLLALLAGFFAYKTYNIIVFFNQVAHHSFASSFYEGFYQNYISLYIA